MAVETDPAGPAAGAHTRIRGAARVWSYIRGMSSVQDSVRMTQDSGRMSQDSVRMSQDSVRTTQDPVRMTRGMSSVRLLWCVALLAHVLCLDASSIQGQRARARNNAKGQSDTDEEGSGHEWSQQGDQRVCAHRQCRETGQVCRPPRSHALGCICCDALGLELDRHNPLSRSGAHDHCWARNWPT